MRRKIIAGNWKMNKTPNEAVDLVNLLKDKVNTSNVDVVFCVPFVDLITVKEALKGTEIKLGAQNMHFADDGAFTGEVSAKMLSEAGADYVIIGHSERRQYFGETNELVNKKAIQAIKNNLIPIICVGETLVEREQGITIDLVRLQVKIAFNNINKEDALKTVIAYEPVWAIGTGITATSVQAEEVCKAIRQVLSEIYNSDISEKIRIQYGGSVTAINSRELFTMSNIDGGLVGGASLKEDFALIVNYE